MTSLSVNTDKNKQVVDITDTLQKLIVGEKISNGVMVVFVKHTTCAITTVDLDPGTDLDYLEALNIVAPKLKYNHAHDPTHFNDHLLSSIIGTNLVVPVENGELGLGTWQKIALFEFNGPRTRNLFISFIKY